MGPTGSSGGRLVLADRVMPTRLARTLLVLFLVRAVMAPPGTEGDQTALSRPGSHSRVPCRGAHHPLQLRPIGSHTHWRTVLRTESDPDRERDGLPAAGSVAAWSIGPAPGEFGLRVPASSPRPRLVLRLRC